MKHDRSMIRHHRERMIANRVRFIKNVIYLPVEREGKRPVGLAKPWRVDGYFAKTKPLNCSCPMCQSGTRAEAFRGKERQAVKAQVWREIE